MDIDEWIEQQREDGRTDEQIRSSMEKAGWDQDTIDEKLGMPGDGDETATIGLQDRLPDELPIDPRLAIAGILMIVVLAATALMLPELTSEEQSQPERPPIAYYSFDSPSRFTIDGAGTEPSLVRSPSAHITAPGISGSSIQFNDTTPLPTRPFVRRENNTYLSRTGLTISMWVYPFQNTTNTGQAANLFSQEVPTSQDWLTIRGGMSGYSLLAAIGGSNETDTLVLNPRSYNLPQDRWNHIALTYRNMSAQLYVNGLLRASQRNTTSFSGLNDRWRIGGDVGEMAFQGRIDELRVYDYDLTADQIQQQYAALNGSATSG